MLLHVVSNTESGFSEGNGAIVIVGVSQDQAGQLMDVLRSARYSAAMVGDIPPAQPPEDQPDLALALVSFADGDDEKAPWPRWLDDLHVPVVALIPASRLDFIDRAIAAGATEVLIMPPNRQEMLLRVRKVMRLAALRGNAARFRSVATVKNPDTRPDSL